MQDATPRRTLQWLDQDDRWLLGLCVARVACTLNYETYAATQPLLMVDWHMSAGQAGWIHSSYNIGYLLSLFVLGLLADRYGAKRIILIASVASAGSGFLFASLARDFVSGFAWHATMALCAGGSYTPVLTLIAQRIPGHRRGRAIGWYIAAGALGYALSLSLSSVMMTASGWRSAFYATACGPVLGIFLLVWVLRRTPNLLPSVSKTEHDGTLWRAVLTNKGAMVMMWGYTFHSWELLGMRPWLPTFLTAAVALGSASGVQAASMGASVGALMALASMAGNIGGGSLSDRRGRSTVILLMSSLSLACSFSIGWLIATPFWLLFLVCLLYSLTAIGDSPVYSTALTECVPSHFLGAAYAIRSVLGFGAGVISPLVFGLVLDWARHGLGAGAPLAWGLAFASLGLGGVLGPLGVLWLHRAYIAS
jgi:MFS family permease